MRTAIATMAVGESYRRAMWLLNKTKADYCERWNLDLILETDCRSARPPSWDKLHVVRELLDEYDSVLWLDADLMIMTQAIDIVSKLEAYLMPGEPMLIARDWSKRLSAGAWYIKRTDWSSEMLTRWYGYEQFVDDPMWESRALTEFVKDDPEFLAPLRITDDYRLLHSHYLNRYGGLWRAGDFSIHWAGLHDIKRVASAAAEYYRVR